MKMKKFRDNLKNIAKERKGRNIRQVVCLTLLALGVLPSVEAMDSEIISYGSKDLFLTEYYDRNDVIDPVFLETVWGNEIPDYSWTKPLKNGVRNAFLQWAEIIGPGAQPSNPVQFIIGTVASPVPIGGYRKNNTVSMVDLLEKGRQVPYIDIRSFHEPDTYVLGTIYVGNVGSEISFDLGDGKYGWNTEDARQMNAIYDGALNETAIIYHEVSHALGLVNGATTISGKGFVFEEANHFHTFMGHLIDENGNAARPTRRIIGNRTDYEALSPEEKKDVFFVDSEKNIKNMENMRGRLYFVGSQVTEALGDKRFQGISGIPLDAYYVDGSPNFAHLDLARSMMSHQDYRSYNHFMEAELALMEDIGYKIDRRNFFGRSIYTDGGTIYNYDSYFGRNREGTAYIADTDNNATYGIGLHVYGSYNTIHQLGNIRANGEAATGIRIDGIQDAVTVNKGTEVHADGKNGIGILVAYGKDHDIMIDGLVSANGENGRGVSFDFGTNFMGLKFEYRGSYMRTYLEIVNMSLDGVYLFDGKDFDRDSFTLADRTDLMGKMGSLSVSGTLSGKEQAVYIAPNAFVDCIDLKDGANITGDITSAWLDFDGTVFDGRYNRRFLDETSGGIRREGKIQVQYNGLAFDYDDKQKVYENSLYTKLITEGDITYNGNINGAQNMTLTVADKTLRYGGTANVINVDVANGASLYGGIYLVNDITHNSGETGRVHVRGTMGRLANQPPIRIMDGAAVDNIVKSGTVAGTDTIGTSNFTNPTKRPLFVADGATLVAPYNPYGVGAIQVEGPATLQQDVKLAVQGLLPGEKQLVVQAQSLKDLPSIQDDYPVSGLLRSRGLVEWQPTVAAGGYGVSVYGTVYPANNMGAMNSWEQRAFDKLTADSLHLDTISPVQQAELRAILNLSPADAKDSFSALLPGGSAQYAPPVDSTIVQRSHAVSDMLLRHVGELQAGVKTETANSVSPVESVWYQGTKHWGRLSGNGDYHGFIMAGGIDWQRNAQVRNGVFLSWGTQSLSYPQRSGQVNDWRLGYYGAYKNDLVQGLWYADVGHLYGDAKRMVSAPYYGTRRLDSDIQGTLLEMGGRIEREISRQEQAASWRTIPYAEVKLSYLHDKTQEETGSYLAQRIDYEDTLYADAETGVSLQRDFTNGQVKLGMGVRHTLTGANRNYTVENRAVPGEPLALTEQSVKTHGVVRLSGQQALSAKWNVAGEVNYVFGGGDNDLSAGVTVGYTF